MTGGVLSKDTACFLYGDKCRWISCKTLLQFFIAMGIKVIPCNKFLRGALAEFFENMVKMCDVLKAALIRYLFNGKLIQVQQHTGIPDTLFHGKMGKTFIHGIFELLTECTAAHGTGSGGFIQRDLTIWIPADQFQCRKDPCLIAFLPVCRSIRQIDGIDMKNDLMDKKILHGTVSGRFAVFQFDDLFHKVQNFHFGFVCKRNFPLGRRLLK